MLTFFKHTILLFAVAISVSVFVALLAPHAHSREDYVQPVDSQRTLPKVTVTSRRGAGFSYGFLSLSLYSSFYGGFDTFRFRQNQFYLEQQCVERDNHRACTLLCEKFPYSDICPLVQDTISVSGKRETTYFSFDLYEIRFGKIVYISAPDEDSENKKEEQRKKLEKRCKNDLNHLFSTIEDFPFAKAFGIKDYEEQEGKIEKYIKQLINYTKPIMTTGIKGYNNGKPVEYLIGLESHNSFYIDKNGKLTRGDNLEFGTIPGFVTPRFRKDKQFRQMLESAPNDLAPRLAIDFHTHPNTKDYIVFPSSTDIAKFIIDKRYKFVDKNALLAIGFMSNSVYHMLFMNINNNQILFEKARKHSLLPLPINPVEKIDYLKDYGEVLKLLFENSKMLIVDSTNNKIDDYLEFFDNNPINQIVGDSVIIPQSCIEFFRESK